MENIFYPATQRRLRADEHIRALTASVKLSYKSFIQLLFVDQTIRSPRAINGLNGVFVDSSESVLHTIEKDIRSGTNKFLLFPVPAQKQENHFDFSFAENTIKKIKKNFGNDVWMAADVCLCSYTSHGHCGVLNGDHSRLLKS